MRKASIFPIAFTVLLAASFAFAQESDLRAQIRADLMQDPRTAEMSEAEREALIDALAQEASDSGAAETYLDAQSTPTFTYDPPPVDTTSPYVAILTAPIVIAILAFLAALLGVALFMLRQRRGRRMAPDLQNTDA